MKRTHIISALTALACVAATFTSCDKVETGDSTINFSVATAAVHLTKTSYGVDGSGFQYIDWAEGDQIRIMCAQSDPTSTDYAVTSAGHEGKADKGKISSDIPLTWGDGTHTFYAVYPSPAMTDAVCTIDGPAVTGTIPAVQAVSSLTGNDDAKVAKPDMTRQYMVAKATAPEKAESVELYFYPMTTALEFTIKNGFASKSAMQVSSIQLSSEAYALNGDFAIDIDKEGVNDRKLCTTTATAAANGTVTINFASPVTVEYGKSLNFTFFLNPGNGGATGINDIRFSISGTNAGNSTNFTRSAKLEKNGAGVAFQTHKKTRIVGIMIPEQIEWNIENEIVVTPWEEGVIKDITLAE